AACRCSDRGAAQHHSQPGRFPTVPPAVTLIRGRHVAGCGLAAGAGITVTSEEARLPRHSARIWVRPACTPCTRPPAATVAMVASELSQATPPGADVLPSPWCTIAVSLSDRPLLIVTLLGATLSVSRSPAPEVPVPVGSDVQAPSR